MGKIYRCEMEVRGYELDSYGHVNHAVYVSYLEHARWKLLESEGINLTKFKEWRRWPVISGIEVKYLKPAFAGEKLEIETQGIEQRRVGFVLLQKIFRDGVQILEAKVTSVTVDENGRPAELPEEMKQLWDKS
jgi:acyl-CoA thioester hydrolase